MLNDLMTAAGETLKGTPWTVYPRPQMKRESYMNLNGAWDFSVNYEKMGQIRVPFCPESKLSCIVLLRLDSRASCHLPAV